MDPSAVAQDKDFLAASPADKIAYLSAQDPEFAKAPKADQIGYIHHLVGQMQPVNPPPTPPGFMARAMQDIGGIAKGIGSQVMTQLIPGSGFIPQSVRDKAHIPVPPPPNPVEQGQQLATNFAQRKAEGHGLPYRLGAGFAESMTPANIAGMEQSAREGDPGGVLGHAAVPIAAAVTPLAVEGGLRVANRIIPSTTRAGAGLNILTDSPDAMFANQTVTPTNAIKVARQIERELEISGEKPPQPIQHFLNNANLNQPVNFYEARTLLKRVNDQVRAAKGFNADATSKLSTRNLKRFGDAIDQDISAQAQTEGFGQDYEAMKNEYRHGKQIIRAGEEIGAPVGALAGYTIGRELGEPLGGTLAGGMVGKMVGRKTTGAVARAVVNRNAGPPRLRSIPSTSEAYTRTLLDAKEGLLSPEEANSMIQRAGGSIKTRPIPQE